MIVLGIHFGHDASVSVVKDGIVLNCVEVERITRAKHAIGVTVHEVELALVDAGVSIDEVDYCSVTSTQRLEYLFEEPEKLSFKVALNAAHAKYCNQDFTQEILDERSHKYLAEVVNSGRFHPYLKRLPDNILENFDKIESIGAVEDFYLPEDWRKAKSLEEVAQTEVSGVLTDENRLGMQLPVNVTLNGKVIPGFMLSHQFAHAAYAYYSSNFSEAAILTHDGSEPGTAYWGGMYYYGEGNALYSVAPHYLSMGNLYERIAFLLNLGYDTGAGKLMGLAPWGEPVFFDEAFVGNWQDGFDAPIYDDSDVAQFIPDWISDKRHPLLYRWLVHCLRQALEKNYDMNYLGNTDEILKPINANLAASTQKLIEETLLKATDVQAQLQANLGRPTKNLCMSGGVALNCPANTDMLNRSSFNNIFVPPAVSDGGLSIGSALAVTHNIFDIQRPDKLLNAAECAYLGLQHDESEVLEALKKFSGKVVVTKVDKAFEHAACMLSNNKLVAWFDGRSETGPRALGHRSILAHPGHKDNWRRVNHVKGRELWRPFAPAVLQEYAEEWFKDGPIPSPFMLFTAQVLNNQLPAITHADGSSRIQTVNVGDGAYYELIKLFHELTGIPVVMNTSYNGPGEPIVETPIEALTLFQSTDLDALFFQNYMIEKM